MSTGTITDLNELTSDSHLSEGLRNRILLVESDIQTADELAHLLEQLGYNVGLASDAKTALLHLGDFAPNLVVTDTYLSDMSGYEFTQILRGAPQYTARYRHIGMLYVTDRRKLIKHRMVSQPEVPMTQYIFKPLNEKEIEEKISKAMHESIV